MISLSVILNILKPTPKVKSGVLSSPRYSFPVVLDFALFELLRSVEVTLVEPLSKNLALPSTLVTIFVTTASPIAGIHPQVKTFDVHVILLSSDPKLPIAILTRVLNQ